MRAEPHRIDTHHHIVPPEYVKSLAGIGITGAIGGALPVWSSEMSLEMMDQNGIQTAITSISAPGVSFIDNKFAQNLARRCNEFSARLIADHPGRFGGFASLPLPYIDATLREIEYALGELKLDGVVMMTNCNGVYLGDPRLNEVFEELNRRKAAVFVHPTDPPGVNPLGEAYPNYIVEAPFDTTRAIINLIYSGTLERCPDISFIFSHAGGTVPFLAWRISLLHFLVPDSLSKAPHDAFHYFKNLYYDTALSFTPYSLGALLKLSDQTRILFGSDYPFAPGVITRQTIEGINSYEGFDGPLRLAVEMENAAMLFPDAGQSLIKAY